MRTSRTKAFHSALIGANGWITIGATLREHKAGIIEHFRSGLSNGHVEAMNAQIQAAKARAKGYATHENLIAISYLLCARLQHLPRNPWLAPTAA